jgi:hypothetical protein
MKAKSMIQRLKVMDRVLWINMEAYGRTPKIKGLHNMTRTRRVEGLRPVTPIRSSLRRSIQSLNNY